MNAKNTLSIPIEHVLQICIHTQHNLYYRPLQVLTDQRNRLCRKWAEQQGKKFHNNTVSHFGRQRLAEPYIGNQWRIQGWAWAHPINEGPDFFFFLFLLNEYKKINALSNLH